MNYLKVWTSFREIIEPLNDGERGRLFTAMLEYAELGTLPEFKGNERFIWPSAKQAIDRAAEKADTLRQNGAKGGRPPKQSKEEPNESKENQTEAKESNENQTEAKESLPFDKEKEKKKEREIKETTLTGGKEKPPARFSPPTVDEVASYCRDRQNDVNAQRFVDSYAAKGWKIGQTPMKDWKAAVRTWEQRDGEQGKKPVKTVSAQQYGQRHYQPGELDAIGEDLMAEARRGRSST